MADALNHARHDLLAIAASVGRSRVEPLLAADCVACADLQVDLAAICQFLPAGALPARHRDYRLTVMDATRLRRRAWRQFITAIGTSRDVLTRPLAAGFTALGIAGLLLGTVATPLGAFENAGADRAAMSTALGEAVPGTSMTPAPVDVMRSPGASMVPLDPLVRRDSPEAAPDSSPLNVLSIGLLAIGGSLFGIRRIAASTAAMR